MTDLLDRSLAEIAAAARNRPDVAESLAAAALARIRERDAAIGSVVATVEHPAIAPGDGPLAGVPYLLKDLQADAADLPLRRGSRSHATVAPTADSTLVARLRAAGATIIGRSNSPEFGLGITTEPLLHGPTANPWNLARSAGGSSGGAAAAVAAGLVPAAHSTDSGGSTRIPAAWCGVVGFKPSRGMLPAGPHRLDDWFGLSHEHAITRTVEDSRLILEATAGFAPGEWNAVPAARPVPPRWRVGLLRGAPGGIPVDPAWAGAASAAADALADAGHEIVELAAVTEALAIGPLFGAIAGAHLANLLTRPGLAPDALEPAVAEVVERGRRMTAVDLVRAASDLHGLGFALARRFADVDLVLSPTTAQPAPLLGTVTTDRAASELFGEIFTLSPFVAMFNVTGGAAISVPWGLDARGMPLGVHLGGGLGDDELVLAAAEVIERASGVPRVTT
ncbi:amidase [Salinibacterium soli]|uniref:Amidase n=1 Tax=Antiquaquibacter soli TaxID=3064523 RepID=A0ABT9BW62_9MICO|nr:amidase [Protaetiibacter sp. WY-16]MDO7883630.1 amidase [Protaetiibacter sp. WY-16]